QTLIHNAQLDDATHNVQVIDSVGPRGLLLLQAPPDVSAQNLTSELKTLPGFQYVIPHDFSSTPSASNNQASSSDNGPDPLGPSAGTGPALAPAAPSGIGRMMLLRDGTVMAQGAGVTNPWYKWTPDSTGSYVNGTWTQLASMHFSRLYFGSNVLEDGR